MRSSIRSRVRSVGASPESGWMGVLGGVGVFVWGCLLFGFFNGYLGSTAFQRGAQLVLGATAIAVLVTVVGMYYSFTRSRLGRVALGGMGVVASVMLLGAGVGFVTLELGATLMIASYILLVAGGTLLGITLLLSGGPRLAGWSLTISGPLFLLTDKVLWEPLNALLGLDVTAFLNTIPFAAGLVLLGHALRERSETAERA